MSVLKCSRQDEVRELLRQGHWPEASAAEVRGHVEGCRECGELVRLTVGFRAVREASLQQAQLMAPGLIWWRAQLRRRQQAMEQVSRPTQWAQVFGILMSVCGGAGLVAWFARIGYWPDWRGSAVDVGQAMKSLAGGIGVLPVAVGMAVLVFVGVLAVWSTADLD
jgi:hypothetical protein